MQNTLVLTPRDKVVYRADALLKIRQCSVRSRVSVLVKTGNSALKWLQADAKRLSRGKHELRLRTIGSGDSFTRPDQKVDGLCLDGLTSFSLETRLCGISVRNSGLGRFLY
jgi:hypothetical protein